MTRSSACESCPVLYRVASIILDMAGEPALPSLSILVEKVAAERETMRAHIESLDTKSGIVLGFAGVLVGLGATAQPTISRDWVFRGGLAMAVVAAFAAAWAFLPRNYPVLMVRVLRDRYLTASETETQLSLLDTQVEMADEAADLLKHKGRRVWVSVCCLAIAAALVVTGTLLAGG
jgi:hypothetical protein